MELIAFRSSDVKWYHQSVALRNRDLYGSIGMRNLSDESKEIEKGNDFFAAIVGDNLIGTVSFYEVTKNHFQLVGMCISRKHQGKGVGSQLVNFALEQLAKKLGGYLIVTTNGRETAYDFYETLGFHQAGEASVAYDHNGILHKPFKKIVTLPSM